MVKGEGGGMLKERAVKGAVKYEQRAVKKERQ